MKINKARIIRLRKHLAVSTLALCLLHCTPEEVTLEKFTIEVDPNPCDSVFTVKVSPKNRQYQLQLYDLLGRLVWNARTKRGEYTASCDTLKQGLYILRAIGPDTLFTKVLVTH